MTTKLHYADVLCLTDGRLLSYDGMEGVYRAFDAVAGPGVTTLAIAYMGEKVKAFALSKFPELARPELTEAIDKAVGFYKNGYGEIKDCMEKYVRPLCEEYYEVEHLPNEEQEKAMNDYGPWLEKTLEGKDVIVAVVGEKNAQAEE